MPFGVSSPAGLTVGYQTGCSRRYLTPPIWLTQDLHKLAGAFCRRSWKTNPRPRLSHGGAFYSAGLNGGNNGPADLLAIPPIDRRRSTKSNSARTSVVCFHVSDLPPYFPACLDQPNSRQKGQAGFTRSSTTASGSLRGETPRACGCSAAMAKISRRASRRSSTRSRVCGGDHVSWTARPS